MNLIKCCSIALLLCTAFYASAQQVDISISGTVTSADKPVEGAIVTLVSDSNLTDITDSNGTFLLSTTTDIINKAIRKPTSSSTVRINGKQLYISIPDENLPWMRDYIQEAESVYCNIYFQKMVPHYKF